MTTHETLHAKSTRVHTSLLAAVEKRCLIWMAERLPIGDQFRPPDGARRRLAMLAAGLCYWAAFGRRRCSRRSRCSPSTGSATASTAPWRESAAMSGRATASTWITCSTPWASCSSVRRARAGRPHEPAVGGWLPAGVLPARRSRSRWPRTRSVSFRISFWKFGPTELRILLAIGSLRLMHSGVVTIHWASLWRDLGCDRQPRQDTARGQLC